MSNTDADSTTPQASKAPRSKGQLEGLVKHVLDGYIVGSITPPADWQMTPYRISRLVMAEAALHDGPVDVSIPIDAAWGEKLLELAMNKEWKPNSELDGIDLVSAGAVTAMLSRWHEIGFCTLHDSPLAFEGYTEAAVTDGLAKLKAQHRAANRQAKKDAKAAEKSQDDDAAEPAQEPAGEPADEPVTDPAFAAPPSYQRPPAGNGNVLAGDSMAGASHPDNGAPVNPVTTSPFGTPIVR